MFCSAITHQPLDYYQVTLGETQLTDTESHSHPCLTAARTSVLYNSRYVSYLTSTGSSTILLAVLTIHWYMLSHRVGDRNNERIHYLD